MSITLPPLPDNLISVSHGPFKPSLYDKDEDYCVRCHTRSIFFTSRQCNPHIDPDALRARDLEVARLVLEAAAQSCEQQAGRIRNLRNTWEQEAAASPLDHAALLIRALEVRHHE